MSALISTAKTGGSLSRRFSSVFDHIEPEVMVQSDTPTEISTEIINETISAETLSFDALQQNSISETNAILIVS